MKRIGVFLLGLSLCWACNDDEKIPQIDLSGISSAESFTDTRDGKEYPCIRIGGQVWMAENLAYYLPQGALDGCYTFNEEEFLAGNVKIDMDRFSQWVDEAIANGKIIDPPGVMFPPSMLISMYISMGMPAEDIIGYMSTYPDIVAVLQGFYDTLYAEAVGVQAREHWQSADLDNGGYTGKYGLLYSYEGALRAVPEGWRLPTDEDWKKLEKYLGMKEEELDKMDSWRGEGLGKYLTVGGEGIGFDALYAGCNAYNPAKSMKYIRLDEGAYFWSSTLLPETDSTNVAIIRNVALYNPGIMRTTAKLDSYKPVLYSVRCIKKEEE